MSTAFKLEKYVIREHTNRQMESLFVGKKFKLSSKVMTTAVNSSVETGKYELYNI